jgi:hypothetical protein
MERRDERADLAARLQGRVNGLAKRRSGFIAEPQKWILFWSVSGVNFLPTAPSLAIARCAGCYKTNGEFTMSLKHRLGALAGFACLALFNICASAADHPYAEGPVVSVSSIRTADGKFDDYMKFVDTNWKQQQEAAKSAGNVLSYQVLNVIPRGPDDPDLLLVVTYKSWAAGLDGALAKNDAVSKSVDGSVATTNQGVSDRAQIRRLLGTTWMQVLNLK